MEGAIPRVHAHELDHEPSSTTTGSEPVRADAADLDDHAARQQLFERISAAGMTTLGQVATITAADAEVPPNDDEPDTFSWIDAATWSPAEQGELELEDLFDMPADDELGDRQNMGWFGLVRHRERPGGIVLSQTGYGHRDAWQTDSDEDLREHWSRLAREHQAFTAATQVRSWDGERTSSGPEIWVASLSDYNNGRLHGVWMDATLDATELHDAVQFMLRNSYERDAEEWAIFDYSGFPGDLASLLGEYPNLATVSKIAAGIEQHGETFAAWASYVGVHDEEALDRFEDHYFGEYQSIEAYAEELLEECGAYRLIDEAPEGIRPYLTVDTEGYARQLEVELHVVDRPGGGVWVFDPQM